MSIRATRTPETGGRGWKGREHVRDTVSHPWPGITRGFDARCICTWAYGPGGIYQVKYADALCTGDHSGGPTLRDILSRLERAADA